uniref:Zinc finger Ran-binding domain-containing protein 2 n=1 Tax=Pygocentrus nattereri TaxID=42514 RepID=A0AAR2KJ61_PYGNA
MQCLYQKTGLKTKASDHRICKRHLSLLEIIVVINKILHISELSERGIGRDGNLNIFAPSFFRWIPHGQPVLETKMSGKSFRVSDGDWICPDKSKCGNVNFARRTSCNRCGREKTTEAKLMKAGGTEIGKTLAEKSRGLFSANDWQCKTCGNVNWARRSECNMCNTPKYAKLEERTGYGGGFNEREDLVYNEREESDGEYDEVSSCTAAFSTPL